MSNKMLVLNEKSIKLVQSNTKEDNSMQCVNQNPPVHEETQCLDAAYHH